MQKKGNACTLLMGMQMSTAIMEDSMRSLKKESRTAILPSDPSSGKLNQCEEGMSALLCSLQHFS